MPSMLKKISLGKISASILIHFSFGLSLFSIDDKALGLESIIRTEVISNSGKIIKNGESINMIEGAINKKVGPFNDLSSLLDSIDFGFNVEYIKKASFNVEDAENKGYLDILDSTLVPHIFFSISKGDLSLHSQIPLTRFNKKESILSKLELLYSNRFLKLRISEDMESDKAKTTTFFAEGSIYKGKVISSKLSILTNIYNENGNVEPLDNSLKLHLQSQNSALIEGEYSRGMARVDFRYIQKDNNTRNSSMNFNISLESSLLKSLLIDFWIVNDGLESISSDNLGTPIFSLNMAFAKMPFNISCKYIENIDFQRLYLDLGDQSEKRSFWDDNFIYSEQKSQNNVDSGENTLKIEAPLGHLSPFAELKFQTQNHLTLGLNVEGSGGRAKVYQEDFHLFGLEYSFHKKVDLDLDFRISKDLAIERFSIDFSYPFGENELKLFMRDLGLEKSKELFKRLEFGIGICGYDISTLSDLMAKNDNFKLFLLIPTDNVKNFGFRASIEAKDPIGSVLRLKLKLEKSAGNGRWSLMGGGRYLSDDGYEIESLVSLKMGNHFSPSDLFGSGNIEFKINFKI